MLHKYLKTSESGDANLKTKCLYLLLIVSLRATHSAFCWIMLKMKPALGISGEMNGSLLMSLCCRDNVNLIIQRAGTFFSFCLFFLTSHDVGAFCALLFSFYRIWLTESRVWLLLCFWYVFFFFYFMMNMYVPLCMSFWYILWILSVWMSMKALPCTVFFLPCTNKLYFSRKSFASHFPSALWDRMHRVCFFCFLEEFSPFTVCVLCSDLMVPNTPFHCTVTLKSPFVFLLSDGFC